jgi:hypothetical protein
LRPLFAHAQFANVLGKPRQVFDSGVCRRLPVANHEQRRECAGYGNVEQIGIVAEEYRRSIGKTGRNDRREEHDVALIALETMDRVSQKIQGWQLFGESIVLKKQVTNPIGLSPERADHADAASVALLNYQSRNLLHDHSGFFLIHRTARWRLHHLTSDIKPPHSGLIPLR